MKEFVKNQKVTYNLMSFTGFKALVIFSLLNGGPKTYQEISDHMLNHPYLKEKISIDTFRVYMNSLKRVGCEIKRTRGEDKVSRYGIVKHPFQLTLNEQQLESITKVYKSLVKNIEIKDLLYLENFLEKIGNTIQDEKFLADIKKISMLKDINNDLLEDLIDCCEKKQQIIIRYRSPNSGEKDIELIADKIEISNNKIYLCGTSSEYGEYGGFPVSRIKAIKDIKQRRTIKAPEDITVLYRVMCTPETFVPSEGEKIVKKEENSVLLEITSSNKFYLKQKFLEYGPSCKIIEPDSIKNEFIELLKEMKAGYYCG